MSKYERWYVKLIDNAKNKNRTKGCGIYYENHHIIPRSIGGSDDNSNMILLTAREHFLAHWMLVKIHKDNSNNYQRMVFAFNSFCMDNRGQRPPSRLYEYARKEYIRMLSDNDEWKKKVSKTMTKKIWVNKDDTCKRVFDSELNEYISDGWVRGRIITSRKPHSEEAKAKISKGNTGKKHTDEWKVENSIRNKNKVWVNNGTESKFIQESEVSEYINNGWVESRLYTNWNEYRKGSKLTKSHVENMKKSSNSTKVKAVNIKTEEERIYSSKNDLHNDLGGKRNNINKSINDGCLYRGEWIISTI